MNDYRILVVDDEEDLCEILKFNLEMEGYQVDTANSAEEALKLDLPSYNLLLLDVMMGEISGFKMASMMKKNKDTAGIPIIFITAKDTVEKKYPLPKRNSKFCFFCCRTRDVCFPAKTYWPRYGMMKCMCSTVQLM